MAKGPVFSGVQQFEFRGVQFDANVISWSDTRRPRIAFHEYLKRDGGEAEYMGRAPHELHLELVFLGQEQKAPQPVRASWKDQLLNLTRIIDQNPIGVLTHAIWGPMNVACMGIDGAKADVENGIDVVTVPISFRESALTDVLSADQVKFGPNYQNSQVTSTGASLTSSSTQFPTAVASVASLVSAASVYAAAAVATVASSGAADPTLPTQLALVSTYAQTARDAIRADPAATSDAVTFATITLVEQLVDSCNQLAETLNYQKPVLAPWQVPANTTLLAIAQAFYGVDGAQRMQEILTNNVAIIMNPAIIPAGTTLYLAPPTVRAI